MNTMTERLQLSDNLLFAQFGEQDTNGDDDAIIEAAGAVAQQRYGNAPWARERLGDAVEGALMALWNYKPMKSRDSLYYKANYALGEGAGQMLKASREERDEFEFVKSFSDLIPSGIEDEDEYLEGILGAKAVYSPVSTRAASYDEDFEFDASNAVFYTENGVVTLRQAAERIAHTTFTDAEIEVALQEGFDHILDEKTEEVYTRLEAWAAGNEVRIEFGEEPEPETCPLDWVWRSEMTPTGPDWSKAYTSLERGMPHEGAIPHVELPFEAEFDYATEDWASVKPEAWKRRKNQIKQLEGADDPKLVEALEALKASNLPTMGNGNESSGGCPGFWMDYADPSIVWNRNPELITDVAAAIQQERMALPKNQRRNVTVEQLVSDDELLELIAPAIEKAIDLYVGDASYNQIMTEYAGRVSSTVKVKGTLAAIRRVSGVDYDWSDEIEDLDLRADKLRKLIVQEVRDEKIFASRAVVVLAKLMGKHPKRAQELGDQVLEESKRLKKVVGQGRFSAFTEMLIAEKMTGLFELDLPKNVVGLVGNVDEGYARHILSNMDPANTVVMGASTKSQNLARKLGFEFLSMPRVGNSARCWGWAYGQIEVVCTHIIANARNKEEIAARLQSLGVKYRFQK
jgi:hypothetical protein